jgi:hypothetical protein
LNAGQALVLKLVLPVERRSLAGPPEQALVATNDAFRRRNYAIVATIAVSVLALSLLLPAGLVVAFVAPIAIALLVDGASLFTGRRLGLA